MTSSERGMGMFQAAKTMKSNAAEQREPRSCAALAAVVTSSGSAPRPRLRKLASSQRFQLEICRGPEAAVREAGTFLQWISAPTTLPYPTLPCPTLPYPTLPYPTLPYPTLPYPTLPYPYPPTLNLLTEPTLPYPSLIIRPTLPYPALPC